ncbi:MAG: 16S rRNA (adenine(1518)-N(6)/adenine(1519)-N(6))-dimethyltransferase RsmA [Pseudomonadota bacterium]
MQAVAALPPIRAQLEAQEIFARKSLGQNFLFDLNMTGKIARAAMPLESDTIVEIGPGPGGLSRALLLAGAQRVIAIEQDKRFEAILRQLTEASQGTFEVIFEDARQIDVDALATGPKQIVANLPYNVGTHLLTGWLQASPWPPSFHRMTLMFQKEVAMRITAGPGDAHYGRLAILANWRCSTHRLFDVPATAFTPPPKITSSIVQLTPRSDPLPCSASALQRITAAAFGQRRKMLRQSLKALGLGTDGLRDLLSDAGLDGTERPETLPIATFVALANGVEAASAGD